MADVPGKFYRATKVRTGVAPSSAGSIEGEVLPPVNPPGSSLNSVGLTMPSAFTVSNSPLTANGTIGVAGAGTVAQYIRGDGSLADFPESSGGGSSVSYYLNGSVDQGTIGGIAYKELSKVPILGAGTDFTINADGYIASFITDAGDPNLLEIPGGNWNFETYFSASSSGGTPTFYVELYKVSGTTATLIASSSSAPELIAFGTNLTPYFSSLAVPTTTLALTDRLAVRYYVTHSGRTITLHTENNHLCQIITTFTTGLTALNGLTAQVQNFAVGTTGTDFNIASATATHTFNLPTASATNRGALSSADWSLFTQAYNDKINSAAVTGTTTKTLTLTQQDGGTITASWSDLNTDAVLSVFGRTGAVVAANGDYTTAQVTESGNLYYTDARSRAALSFAAGSGAYNTSTGVITIPTNNNQITNGAGYITSAALSGYLPLIGGTLTGQLLSTYKNSVGALVLTSGDTNTQSNNFVQITLGYDGANQYKHFITTRHNSASATGNSIDFYTSDSTIFGAFPTNAVLGLRVENGNISTGSITASGNITGANLSGTNTGNVTIGTANGLSLSGQTLSLGLASGSANGALSSSDWTTFNNKQAAGNYVTLDTAQTISESKTFAKINSGGSGDYTNMTSFPIRITGTSGGSNDYWRIPFLSNDSGISGVFNFQTGKSVYWGEPTDTGTYFFRGRGINVQALSGTSATFSGNVGTGGASATYSLTTYNASNGTTAAFGGTARGIRIDNDGTYSSGRSTIFGVDSTFYGSYQPLSIEASSLALQAVTGGNVLIGTTSDNGARLQVSGTATFSGIVGINGLTEAGWGLKVNQNLKVENNNGTTVLQVADTASGGKTWSLISSGSGNAHSVPAGTFYLRNSSDGLTAFQIASTGAATFSSSVTIRDGLIINPLESSLYTQNGALSYYSTTNGVYLNGAGASGWLRLNAAGTENDRNSINIFGSTASSSNTITFRTNYNTSLTIASTGAATFSSSVTAGSSFITPNGFGLLTRNAANTANRNVIFLNSSNQISIGNEADINRITLGTASSLNGFRMYSAGNIGIGPTTTDFGETFMLATFKAGSSNYLRVQTDNNASYDAGGLFTDGTNNVYYGMLRGTTGLTGAFSVTTGGTTRFNITSGGNVGIGTPTPSQALTIQKSGFPIIDFYDGATGRGDIGFNTATTSFNIGAYGSIPMVFYAGGSPRMTITSGGNVGIINTNPQGYLDIGGVADTANFNNLILRSGNSDVASPLSNQILFGYAGTMNYAHAIKTRAQSGSQAGNAFDFYVWKYGDSLTTPAGQRVMAVEGNGVRIANSGGNLINPVSSSVLTVNGLGYFESGIRTGTLDTGYVAGNWKLGRAILGTQPAETYQIIVEINGQLYAIGAANI